MQDLIKKLQEKHDMSEEQAKSVLETITNFIKEKFPMVAGAVDNLFASGDAKDDEDLTDYK